MRRLLRLAVGAVFVLGGIAKFLPWPEDPYATLNAAMASNAGHLSGPITRLAVAHASLLIPVVGLAMIVTGSWQITGRRLRTAALSQLALMACFALILHRAFPAVLAVDGVIALAVLLGAVRANGR